MSLRVLYGPIYNFGVTIHSIPIIATAPLLALWLGTGPQVQIAIAALASQFPMLVGTIQGLQAADARQRELMHVLAASRWQMLRYLLIPSALPYLFAGFKIAAPSAVLGAITAEWAGADQGVGAMMLYALFSYDTPKVWLSVVLTCLLAGRRLRPVGADRTARDLLAPRRRDRGVADDRRRLRHIAALMIAAQLGVRALAHRGDAASRIPPYLVPAPLAVLPALRDQLEGAARQTGFTLTAAALGLASARCWRPASRSPSP